MDSEHDGLFGADVPRPELEVDGVDADAPHPLAQADARKDLVKRVRAIERLDRRRLQRPIDVVLRSRACIDNVLLARNIDMGRRQGDHEGAERKQSYAGRDGPIFEQNEPPAIGQEANAADWAAIGIDLDLDAAAVGANDVRNHVAVRRTHRLRASAVVG